jgi:cation-transporting P-type ATPase 13A2
MDPANSCSLVPFVVTIVVALLFSCYMLLDPALWLASFMQLTHMSVDFRLFILVLGCGYFLLAWMGERYVLPRLAKVLGLVKGNLGRFPKQRKAYKVIMGKMRI